MKNLIILTAFAGAVVFMGSNALKNRVSERFEHQPAAAAEGVPLQNSYTWTGDIAAGHAIEIKGINGDVSATHTDGDQVEVVVEKSGRRSNPDRVRIQAIEHAGGVTICAVYPSSGRRTNVCAPGDRGRLSSRNNDTEVDFMVRVPRGVNFIGRTINGDVDAEGLTGEAFAHTVNGDVNIETTGRGRAETVNGDIDARIGEINADVHFQTVNGDMTLVLPGDVNATVEGQTVSGSINSDFPLTIRGQFGPRRITGMIGAGGPRIGIESVNGEIRLVRGN